MQTNADNGIINIASPYSVTETLDRLAALVTTKGMTVFARIDQGAAAQSVDLSLRPTQLLIFGDPRGGTPLMNAHPSLALDLPLKALAWQAEDGQVWLGYNSPAYLQQRHGLPAVPFQALSVLIEQALTAGS